MAGVGERILTLLFPNRCFLCGQMLVGERWLCEGCEGEMPYTAGQLCTGCGKQTGDCVCAELDGSLAGATAPLFYSGAAAGGIHRFKYDGRRYYGARLAGLMADAVRADFPDVAFDGVAWVPMYWQKERQRGFCPAKLLARELAKRLGIPVLRSGLAHTGRGGAQMEQGGRDARRENARRNFTVRRDAVLTGELVLLVDDVLTTGSTAERCASLLLRRGAEAVWLVCAATTAERESARI